MNSWMAPYDTGWINRSDWTNVHLGSTTTKDTDSNVVHNLNAPLYKLFVQVLFSTDGTDNNSYLVGTIGQSVSSNEYGIQIRQVDANNIVVQTGDLGILYFDDDGNLVVIDTEDWYYKVRVYYLG